MSSGSVTTGSLDPYVACSRYQRSWSGGNSPRERIPQNYNVDGSMQFSPLVSVTGAPWYFGGDFGPISAWQLGGVALQPSPFDGNTVNDMINNIWGQVKGADFNAAVSLSQADQSFKMIGDTALKIANSIRFGRRGDFGRAISALTGKPGTATSKRVSNNWLELQYGWKPMMEDIRGACEIIANHVNKPQEFRFTSRKRAVTQLPDTSEWYKYSSSTQTDRVQMIVILRDQPNMTDVTGITDPASIAWELTPYSFVFDWFVPVGDFLSAAAAARALEGRCTVITSTLKKVRCRNLVGKVGIIDPHGGPNYDIVVTPNNAVIDSWSFNRSVTSSVPLAMPNIKPLSKSLSVGHGLNAIALIENLRR